MKFKTITPEILQVAKGDPFQGLVGRTEDPDGCWPWMGSSNPDGYGTFSIKGKNHRAHRLMLALVELPPNDYVLACHHCDNPSCVRPSHLYWGSFRDNSLDAIHRGQLKMNNCRLDHRQADDIRLRFRNGLSRAYLAARFGVCRATVDLILKEKSWTSKTPPHELTTPFSGPITCLYRISCTDLAVSEAFSVLHRGWIPVCENHKTVYLRRKAPPTPTLREIQP